MHIKFLRHGAGLPRKAAKYLLQTHDHNKVRRAEVRLLSGDPEMFITVVESLPFVLRYTSGVIAFAKNDQPTDNQIKSLLHDYEKLALGGLDPSRHCWMAVLHRDEDGTPHIHTLHARVDLETGLSHNIAPPKHLKAFNSLRDYYNYKHGWDRPDDPALARLVQPSHTWEAQQLRDVWMSGESTSRATAKAQITEYITQQITLGTIHNRADMVSALSELGSITRQGIDYLSLKVEGFEQNIRLKGLLFHEQFNSRTYAKNSRENEADRSTRSRKSTDNDACAERARRIADPAHQKLAADAFAGFEAAIANRTRYNAEYYQKRDKHSVSDHQSDESKPVATNPAYQSTNTTDGVVVFNPDELEYHSSTHFPSHRLDQNTDQSHGRTVSDDQRLDRTDRSSMDDLLVSTERTESLSSTQALTESHHESESNRNEFTELFKTIDADCQRATEHALTTARKLRADREKRLHAAKQRAEDLAKIKLGRAENRTSQQHHPVLARIREWTESLRERISQQHQFANELRTIRDRTNAAFTAVHRQIERFVERFGVARHRVTYVETSITHTSAHTPKLYPQPVLAPRSQSKPIPTPPQDECHDINI